MTCIVHYHIDINLILIKIYLPQSIFSEGEKPQTDLH